MARAARLAELLQECQKEIASLAEENAWMRRQLGYAEDDLVPPESTPEAEIPPEVAAPLKNVARNGNHSVTEHQLQEDYPFDEAISGSMVNPRLASRSSDTVPRTSDTQNRGERVRYELTPMWQTEGNIVKTRRSVVTKASELLADLKTEEAKRVAEKRAREQKETADRSLLLRLRRMIPSLPLGPNHIFKLSWDVFGLLLICWDLFYIPFQALEPEPHTFLDVMGWITLLFWTSDMVMSNMCGYYKNGELIMDQRKITVNYVKTWLLVDLIIVVPDWFSTLSSGDDAGTANLRIMRAARALRVLRLLRLLKLQRLTNIVYDFIDSEYSFIMVTMLRLVVFIVVLNHVIACVWYWIGKLAYDQGMASWLKDTPNGDMLVMDVPYRYTTSLHWSLTQFTPASMEVSARNVMERVVSIIVLFFALITFSSIVGSITTSMTALRSMQGDTKKQFWMLRRYLSYKKIPQSTKSRIIKFLEHQTAQKQSEVSLESIQIVKLLSGPLQNLLAYELNRRYIEAHPFFLHLQERMRPIVIRLCYSVLDLTNYAPEDVVFRPMEAALAMYFVCGGTLDYKTDKDSPTPTLGESCWLSEPALWTQWWHRGQLNCVSAADIFSVKPDGFVDLVKVHAASWNFCRSYADRFVAFLNSMPSEELSDVFTETEWLEACIGVANYELDYFEISSPTDEVVLEDHRTMSILSEDVPDALPIDGYQPKANGVARSSGTSSDSTQVAERAEGDDGCTLDEDSLTSLSPKGQGQRKIKSVTFNQQAAGQRVPGANSNGVQEPELNEEEDGWAA
eukprot:TRINITY_DN51222_c0_g1_i1.p1 TRINITY_DN51222_c0_g1~~TRINITY_DN51222_c0_g1_i1.p1  ORF type:complete len:815 (+),score=146.93 TRINITY_DN51222_c0_g1_i1:65-2446(+)